MEALCPLWSFFSCSPWAVCLFLLFDYSLIILTWVWLTLLSLLNPVPRYAAAHLMFLPLYLLVISVSAHTKYSSACAFSLCYCSDFPRQKQPDTILIFPSSPTCWHWFGPHCLLPFPFPLMKQAHTSASSSLAWTCSHLTGFPAYNLPPVPTEWQIWNTNHAFLLLNTLKFPVSCRFKSRLNLAFKDFHDLSLAHLPTLISHLWFSCLHYHSSCHRISSGLYHCYLFYPNNLLIGLTFPSLTLLLQPSSYFFLVMFSYSKICAGNGCWCLFY